MPEKRKNKTNVPNLRFPGFVGEWEIKKIGQVAEIGRGKSKHRPRDAEFLFGGKYPFIQTGDIRKTDLYLTEFTQTYSEAGLKQSKLWNENTLCITIAANIAETAILKIKACFPDSVIGLIPKEDETLVLFVKHLFDKFKIQIQSLSQGVAQDNLNQEKLSKIEFSFPNLKEQDKITAFLALIDDRIQTQIKIIEELKLLKSTLSKKIFTQQLRFKDEKGSNFPNWELKKLEDCLDYIQPTNYLVSSTEYDDSYKTPVLTAGKTFILGYTNEDHGIFADNLPVIIFDDFTTATQFVNFSFKAKSSAMKILIAKENVSIKFMYEIMQMMNYEIGGHERHWISKFAPLEVSIPSLPEQTAIANSLSEIDEKVEIEKKILQLYKNQKKYFLRNLFI